MSRRKLWMSPSCYRRLSSINVRLPKYSLFQKFVVPKVGIKVEENCAFEVGNRMWSMGAFSYSRSALVTHGNLTVGRYTSIADSVAFMGISHPLERFTTSPITYDNGFLKLERMPIKGLPEAKDTIIGHDVWIGSNVLIKPGVRIGNGAVIAANAVVTKDVEPFSVVGGVPAKIIRMRFEPEIVTALQHLKWWDYDARKMTGLVPDLPIEEFVEWFTDRKQSNEFSLYKPRTFEI